MFLLTVPAVCSQWIIAVGSDEAQKDSIFHTWEWESSTKPDCSGEVRYGNTKLLI